MHDSMSLSVPHSTLSAPKPMDGTGVAQPPLSELWATLVTAGGATLLLDLVEPSEPASQKSVEESAHQRR